MSVAAFRRFFLPILAAGVLLVAGCSKSIRETVVNPPDPPGDSTSFKNGVFIVNEGNFNWGNASVTYIENSTDKVYGDLFSTVNERPLGDVAESMKTFRGKGYIVVNNSNRVEVVSLEDFKSVAEIDGFSSPRYFQVVDSSKAYVTNMQKGISVVDLTTNQVVKTISTSEWTECMVAYQNLVFATCVGKFSDPNSTRKPKLLVISTKEDKIIDSLQCGKEPLSIVIDKKQKVWVLSTGGWDMVEPASLIRVDPVLMTIEKAYIFPQSETIPSRLCINPTGDTLYFLRSGIFRMPVTAAALPETPFIAANGRLFYGLDVNPSDGSVWATDAVDYVSNGRVYHFSSSDGTLIKSYEAGRIPGSFCFPASTGKK